MLNKRGHRGRIKISVNGEIVAEIDNVVTSADHDLRAAQLADGTLDGAIYYVALGDDNTTPDASDTALGNELFRKQVTVQTAGAADSGEMNTTVYIAPAEAIFEIEEIGWFAGADASATADSGILVARVLYNRDKAASESIQIDREDTFQGV